MNSSKLRPGASGLPPVGKEQVRWSKGEMVDDWTWTIGIGLEKFEKESLAIFLFL